MLLRVDKLHKSIGAKDLFENLSFMVNEGEKIGLIGRNGLGKTSLVKILVGEDKDYSGNIEIKNGVRIVLTKQEHYFSDELTPLDYILDNIPKFRELQEKIRLYETKGEEEVSLEDYCDAITEFSSLDYYSIEGKVIQSLLDFQLDEIKILGPLANLSGGEKRFVELVKVMYSGADLALIDEPTNHMDYVGKEKFIEWLRNIDKTLIVITHDRDVLKVVDRILEVKEKTIFSFSGNYDSYIEQNNVHNISSINQYESDIRALEKAEKQLKYAKMRKERSKVTKARTSARIRQERFEREYEKLANNLKKPSLWIDKQSLNQVSEKIVTSYSKYKETNINIGKSNTDTHKKLLLNIKNLSLGYEAPLFESVSFELNFGDKIMIRGRNGAGKSTLVKTIISAVNNEEAKARIFKGEIKVMPNIKIGVYEQEIDEKYLKLTLEDALTDLYSENNVPLGKEKLIALLKNYLFDPQIDAKLTMDKLSGGQKARFQLIKMFVNDPNLLILDEPTNHLDLPSIEELESALNEYSGGIIYVTHDSYFVEAMGGGIVDMTK